MSDTKTIQVKAPVSFPALLTILFIGLKLTGYIDWSWWWVLSPLWLPVALIAVLAVLWVVAAALAEVLGGKR